VTPPPLVAWASSHRNRPSIPPSASATIFASAPISIPAGRRTGQEPRRGPRSRFEPANREALWGQRAQLALTLAIAKRPELLLLDEPVASLDPLARREFLQILMETVADQEVSIVLSSHLVSDIERVCDYLIVLADSRVQLAGDVDDS